MNPPPADGSIGSRTPQAVQQLRVVAACAVLTALAFVQDGDYILVDTKVDLAVNPMGWLANALHLWNPSLTFGELQNQAYGYLWPMGPFFALGDLAGIPAWVVQRLWWALLLCVGFTGANTLAGRLGIGTPASRLIAAFAFALSPRILSELGTISVEAWPSAVAPWVLVPLIRLRDGVALRRPVIRSALIVACAGGVNATAVFAVIPLAALWLATLTPVRRRLSALAAWGAAVLCAVLWWLGPLLILGRYSPPFLDYIETGEVTTRTTDLVSTLRGTSHWLAYLNTAYGPQWPTGWRLAVEPALVVATLVVAGLGLAGLARRGMPHRGFLIAGLLAGAAMVGFGHVGEVPGFFSEAQRAFLDGAGAPLRNVHKFDVLLRLPLALGVAHLLGLFFRLATAAPKGWPAARLRAAAVSVLACAAVAVTAHPALANDLKAPGSYENVPDYWHQAAGWVDEHAGLDRTLVVPAARFPKYTWGGPTDEIAQSLLRSRWAVRSSIPLTQPATIRMLDAVESVFATGQGSPGLADVLARSGIKYLLVRSDIEYGRADTARPLLVRQALTRSAGLSAMASFGPPVGGSHLPGVFIDDGLDVTVPALQIFRVGAASSPVVAYDLQDVQGVVGGPESLLDLAAAGRLTDAPAMLAGDLAGITPGSMTVTDGLRRREVAFGQARDNTSATMTADAPRRLQQPAPDYLPEWAAGRQTTARYPGLESIAASSSLGFAQPLGGGRQEHQPYAALDGDRTTSWRSSREQGPVGQWLQVRLPVPRVLDELRIVVDQAAEAIPTVVMVEAGRETVSAVINGDEVTVKLSGSDKIATVRLIVKETRTVRAPGTTVGFTEVRLPGLNVERTLATPPVPPSTRPASVVLSAAPAIPACFFLEDSSRCSAGVARRSEDGGLIDRTVALPVGAEYEIEAWARPQPGAALSELLDGIVTAANPAGSRPVVESSSAAVLDPAGRAGAAMDGNGFTTWRADPADPGPWLRLTWPQPRNVAGLRFAFDLDAGVSRPTSVTVIGGDGTRTAVVDGEGIVRFDEPLRSSHLTILFTVAVPNLSYDPYQRVQQVQPVGVSELAVEGDAGTVAPGPDNLVALPCGSGPAISAGGVTLQTRLSATYRQLYQLRDIPATVCDDSESAVVLQAGENRIVATADEVSTPLRLALDPVGTTRKVPAPTGLSIDSWESTERAVTLPVAGAARVLAVRETSNHGWQAVLGGVTLRPVVVDGWQQGWVVPAGAGGLVTLTFAPDRAYRAVLIGGAALVLGMLVLAWWPSRRKVVAPRPAYGPAGLRLASITGAIALTVIGGAASVTLLILGSLAHLLVVRRSRADRGAARFWNWARAWAAPLGFAVAAWLAAGEADPHAATLPQLLGLVAMVALWISLLPNRPASYRQPQLVAPLHQGPLHQVVADGGQHEAGGHHHGEGGGEVTGEDGTPSRRVDDFEYERMP